MRVTISCLDDNDREMYLVRLGEVVARFNWRCHAYCLMDNHYHLIIETPDGNLALGMRQLNGVYTQRFNRRHGRVGPSTVSKVIKGER